METWRQQLYSDYLAHHGVLGQRWGIRRFQPYSLIPRGSGKGGKEIGQARKSHSLEKKRRKAEKKVKTITSKASRQELKGYLQKYPTADEFKNSSEVKRGIINSMTRDQQKRYSEAIDQMNKYAKGDSKYWDMVYKEAQREADKEFGTAHNKSSPMDYHYDTAESIIDNKYPKLFNDHYNYDLGENIISDISQELLRDTYKMDPYKPLYSRGNDSSVYDSSWYVLEETLKGPSLKNKR